MGVRKPQHIGLKRGLATIKPAKDPTATCPSPAHRLLDSDFIAIHPSQNRTTLAFHSYAAAIQAPCCCAGPSNAPLARNQPRIDRGAATQHTVTHSYTGKKALPRNACWRYIKRSGRSKEMSSVRDSIRQTVVPCRPGSNVVWAAEPGSKAPGLGRTLRAQASGLLNE